MHGAWHDRSFDIGFFNEAVAGFAMNCFGEHAIFPRCSIGLDKGYCMITCTDSQRQRPSIARLDRAIHVFPALSDQC